MQLLLTRSWDINIRRKQNSPHSIPLIDLFILASFSQRCVLLCAKTFFRILQVVMASAWFTGNCLLTMFFKVFVGLETPFASHTLGSLGC